MQRIGAKNPFGVTAAHAKPATEAQILKLERRLNARLPAEYRRFLQTINGGRRANGGWELSKFDLCISAFCGLRRGSDDLAEAVDRYLNHEEAAELFPPDTIPICDELTGKAILLKYQGKDAGAIGYLLGGSASGSWRKIASGFDRFIAMLSQQPEAMDETSLRAIIERDDAVAMGRSVASVPVDELDRPRDGYTLLQRAANAGAAKVVALLVDRGARSIAGLGTVNMSRHCQTIKILLTRGRYKPTVYDWQGAAAFGGPEPAPSRSLLEKLVQAAKNLLNSKPSKEQERVLRLLEAHLARTSVARKKKKH